MISDFVTFFEYKPRRYPYDFFKFGKSKGDLFEWNEWNPAWYARPEGEFEREGTPSYIWMKFGKFRKILENLEKFWKIYVHRKINAFWQFNVWLTSFLLFLAKCILFSWIMSYKKFNLMRGQLLFVSKT